MATISNYDERMELTTGRLTLREFTYADFDAVHAYASDPQTSIFQEWGPNSRQDTVDFLDFCITSASSLPRTAYTLAITLSSGVVIGSIGLTVRQGAEAEIGYTLNPAHWGNGYATEAVRSLLDFGFLELGLARVTATCRPGNHASSSVLRKLGMVETGHLKNDRLIRGEWQDSLVFVGCRTGCH